MTIRGGAPGIAVAAAVHQKKGRLSFLHDMVIIYGNFWTGNTISFRALQGGRNSVKHNQVFASEMKYKNSANTWVSFTNGNNVTREEWPKKVPTPDGRRYILEKSYIGNAQVYASLKF
ncbi:hypothetical protein ABDB91_10950 [Desulfoscipio sp. XC116]|uniref:hypothetical protein n=1 Tax=Desulfoscipio sp. XC116 TaxID=3144975 RepID=UPI00325AE1F9